MHSGLAGLAVVVLAGLAGGPERAEALWCPSGEALELVAGSNGFRAGHGLGPLEPDARLFLAADRLARDLARRGELTHVDTDGGGAPERAAAAGYVRTIVAENIAAGQTEPGHVVVAWSDSPKHRANLLDARVRHAGAAHAVGRPACPRCPPHYWVLVLGATRGITEPIPLPCP